MRSENLLAVRQSEWSDGPGCAVASDGADGLCVHKSPFREKPIIANPNLDFIEARVSVRFCTVDFGRAC